MITPTYHERAEWNRMGRAAKDAGYQELANRYLTVSYPEHSPSVSDGVYDDLMSGYRAWLLSNTFTIFNI